MEKIRCECGHVNPYGTVICESCGKPVIEDTGLLNMRYEGVARRSQTYSKKFIDKIWNFFSSVKVGIWIIILTFTTSSLGTILPQQFFIPPEGRMNPGNFYKEEYGFVGEIYYTLGFHDLYGSWWYMLLIASLGVSLIISSIDRVVPLYRALKTQKVTRHESFLKRQRIFGESKVVNVDETLEKAKSILKQKKYNVREENGNIAVEKNRFARWGPYINHIGIIIFLIGCMLRYFPGMYIDNHVWVREGQTVVIPGTQGEYYIENEEFIVELYDEDDPVFGDMIGQSGSSIVKTYQTNAVLYKQKENATVGEDTDLIRVDDHQIIVNDPFKFDGFALYQVDYKLNEFSQMSFNLINKETEENFGRIDVNLEDPIKEYDLGNDYHVNLIYYFPDYYFNANGEPDTRSRIPNNPAFVFEMITPDKSEGEVSFLAIGQNLEPFGENDFRLSLADMQTRNATALTVRKDYTIPILIVGGIIFMFGLVQGSYWAHRRIWLQRINGEIWIAGHTNKNWNSLMKDIENVVENTDLQLPIDQVMSKEDKKEDKEENVDVSPER
jgi:cytochrome c biogenesis protein